MLVGARHDEAVEPPRRQLLAQQREPRGARQPGEILGREAVAIILGELGAASFQCLGQRRRGRVGDQRMPGGADLGRRRQDAGDQRGDAVGVERRPGFLQQLRQSAPIRLLRLVPSSTAPVRSLGSALARCDPRRASLVAPQYTYPQYVS